MPSDCENGGVTRHGPLFSGVTTIIPVEPSAGVATKRSRRNPNSAPRLFKVRRLFTRRSSILAAPAASYLLTPVSELKFERGELGSHPAHGRPKTIRADRTA